MYQHPDQHPFDFLHGLVNPFLVDQKIIPWGTLDPKLNAIHRKFDQGNSNTKRNGHSIVYMQEPIYPSGSKSTPKLLNRVNIYRIF